MALTENAGDAAVKRTAQPGAAVSGQSLRATRKTRRRVAPPRSGLRSQGQPSQANGASSSANPGQYEDSMAPDGEDSMNHSDEGTIRGTSSGGTCACRCPRAKTCAWKSTAYSSMESGCARYTSKAQAARTSVTARMNLRGSAASRATKGLSENAAERDSANATATMASASQAAAGSFRSKRYRKTW